MARRKMAAGALAIIIAAAAQEFKEFPIVNPKRLELAKEYSRQHYGVDSYDLKDPKIIVIHYTGIPTLQKSLDAFRAAFLPGHRREIKGHGLVNVGVHFVVDRNGDVYTLLPTNVIGRHVIGFNHVSIGIENVAANANQLTEKQLVTNVMLVKWLTGQFPSIEYLIGHHEYQRSELPHYRLFKELDGNYKPTIKLDPGKKFMDELRRQLQRAGIHLND